MENLDAEKVEEAAVSSKTAPGVALSKEQRMTLIEMVCLGVVMVALGFLLTLPIIFYHLPVENVSSVTLKQVSDSHLGAHA